MFPSLTLELFEEAQVVLEHQADVVDAVLKHGDTLDTDTEVSARPPQLVQQLVEVWQRSVQATHLFLSAPEIAAIRTYVPQALCGVEHLIVAQDESGTPVGFMGVQENRLEMLFLDPEARGQGLGARLLCLGMEQYGVSELTVNEQNPAAAGFYQHMGFAVYRRSELDEQGGPYPILYMRRG